MTRFIRRRSIIAAVGAVVLLVSTLSGCGNVSAFARESTSTDKTISIGYQSGMPSLTLAKEQGKLDKLLKQQGYSVSWHYFASTSDMVDAAVSSTNNIDFGGGGATASIFAQSSGKPIVKVAAQTGAYHGSSIVTRADSGLHSVADLKGKRVAVTKGTLQQYLLVAALDKVGLSYDDIKPVYLSASDALAAYKKGGQFDAWSVWDPITAQAQSAVKTKVLADNESVWGNKADQEGASYYFTTSSFLKGHKKAIETIISQLADAETWYKNHPQQAAKLLSKVYNADYAPLLTAAKRVGAGHVVAIDKTYLEAYQNQSDLFAKLNVIPKKIDAFDTQYYWAQS